MQKENGHLNCTDTWKQWETFQTTSQQIVEIHEIISEAKN